MVPIPFLADTEAPHMAYLGTRAWKKLKDMTYIGYGIHMNTITGTFKWKNNHFVNVSLKRLPSRYEMLKYGIGDVRTNVMGAAMMSKLGIIQEFRKFE